MASTLDIFILWLSILAVLYECVGYFKKYLLVVYVNDLWYKLVGHNVDGNV